MCADRHRTVSLCSTHYERLEAKVRQEMEGRKRFNSLRLRYKAAFDAHRVIAMRNAELLASVGSLSAQELAEEARAAAGLERAREELRAARFDSDSGTR